jgi:hypothetical protein
VNASNVAESDCERALELYGWELMQHANVQGVGIGHPEDSRDSDICTIVVYLLEPNGEDLPQYLCLPCDVGTKHIKVEKVVQGPLVRSL